MKINNLGLFRDEFGNTYEIIEEVSQKTSRPLNGIPTTHDGAKGYRTACGIPVNVKNGVYCTWDNVVLIPVE
ncbi:hypothetical protein L4174_021335 [Photobacterium sp. CCB-ST2H9]|uniref:hypothetical protein n=1 Tax=Photobacterium sp. CCB-ST2H9 TaxID=2912855 RepID=UPI00200423EF|nr:hypothetical protein [Photobacterium sp. CCB-ST2H9]UTM59249.1 hypothetical protein L4174_021335 [Photobacterium sp. CCB-ST2H9]